MSNEKTLTEYVYAEKPENINKTIEFTLEKNEFTYLHRKSIDIEVWRPRKYLVVGPKLKGKFSIKLSDFRNKCCISNKFSFELESHRIEPSYEVTLKIKQPCQEKEFKEVSNPVFNISKTYLAFSKDIDYSLSVNERASKVSKQETTPVKEVVQKPKNISEPKKVVESEEKKQNKKSDKDNKEDENNKDKKEEIIKASDFSTTELKDPDDVECLNSLVVLENSLKNIEEDLKKIEGRPPMSLRQNKIKISCKLKMLKEKIESGDLSLEDYVSMIVMQYQRDQKLLKYFSQNKEEQKMKIVEKRLPFLKKEVEEGLKMIKK